MFSVLSLGLAALAAASGAQAAATGSSTSLSAALRVPAEAMGPVPSNRRNAGYGGHGYKGKPKCYFQGRWLGNNVLTFPSGDFPGTDAVCLGKQTKVFCQGGELFYCCDTSCDGLDLSARPQYCVLEVPTGANYTIPATCGELLQAPGQCQVSCPNGTNIQPPAATDITCTPSPLGAVIGFPAPDLCKPIAPPPPPVDPECERKLAEAERQIELLEATIVDLNKEIASLQQQLESIIAQCTTLCQAALEEKDKTIAELQGQIADLKSECTQQCTLIIQQKDEEIAGLQQQLADLEQQCTAQCSDIIAQKNAEIATLQQTVDSLTQAVQLQDFLITELTKNIEDLRQKNQALQAQNEAIRKDIAAILTLLAICKNCGQNTGFLPTPPYECVPCSQMEKECPLGTYYVFNTTDSRCSCESMALFPPAPIGSSLDYTLTVLAGGVGPTKGPGNDPNLGWCYNKKANDSTKLFWRVGYQLPSLIDAGLPNVTGTDMLNTYVVMTYYVPLGSNNRPFMSYYWSLIADAKNRTRTIGAAGDINRPAGEYLFYVGNQDPINVRPDIEHIQLTAQTFDNNFNGNAIVSAILNTNSIAPAGSIAVCVSQSGMTFTQQGEVFGFNSEWTLPPQGQSRDW